MSVGARTSGWHRAPGKGALELYYNGTLLASITATNAGFAFRPTLDLTATSSIAAGTSVDAGTALVAVTTLTAGTGLTVTTGNNVVTAGDHLVTAGNIRLGVVSTFATTEPTSAYIMKVGTAAAGAITTSGGIMTDGVNIQKIIADGTVSAVET